MKNPKFIVVEGPDGVGKTTTAKKLAEKLGYTYIKTPTSFYIEHSKHFTKEIPFLSRFFFYCAGVYESYKEAEEVLNKNQGVVLDRYLESLRVYHELLTGLNLNGHLMDFPKPNLTIILLANLDILTKRIKCRPHSGSDSFLERNYIFLDKVLAKYRALKGNDRLVTIDTEIKTIDQVVDDCLSTICRTEDLNKLAIASVQEPK